MFFALVATSQNHAFADTQAHAIAASASPSWLAKLRTLAVKLFRHDHSASVR